MTDPDQDARWAAEDAGLEARAADDDPAGLVAHSRAPKAPAQVYTVRIPVERLAELRLLAADRGVPPSVLLRSWAIEHLDAERTGRSGGIRMVPESELVATLRSVVREELAKGA
ncbi:MAG: hypothetical protein ACRDYB_12135 [Acidimicrobiales bacterium]